MQASGAKAREMLVSEGKGRQEAPPRGVNLRLVAKNFLLSFAFCCCYLRRSPPLSLSRAEEERRKKLQDRGKKKKEANRYKSLAVT